MNRSAQRGSQLAAHVAAVTTSRVSFEPWVAPVVVGDADVLVNATSVGLFPDSAVPDVDFASVRSETVVADVIPNPPRTGFLTATAERGCRTLDGLGMLVNQGVIGIRHWTGLEADPAVMYQALSTVLR